MQVTEVGEFGILHNSESFETNKHKRLFLKFGSKERTNNSSCLSLTSKNQRLSKAKITTTEAAPIP